MRQPDALTLVWTYDLAVAAAADAATGRLDDARVRLDRLAALQKPDGALGFAVDERTGAVEPLERTGAIAWVGLAAAQHRIATGSDRYDALMDGVAGWLLRQRVTAGPGRGLPRGGPDVGWISSEHAFEARAFLHRLATFTGSADLHDAVADLDAGIERELLVVESATRAHVGQGVGDDVRPIDGQALGIQWLLGQGRTDDAARVAAAAEDGMLVTGRRVEGHAAAGPFTGYRPFADGRGPDVLWMEGTLQMRMARSALGLDVGAIDASADRWAALGPGPDLLLHADVTVAGHPAGEYGPWPAAAPAAWLRLSRSGSDLLR